MTETARGSWDEDYPRLHDLFDGSDKTHRDNYFKRFPCPLDKNLRRRAYDELERRLSLLSVSAWAALRAKALPYVVKKDADRRWAQLFDTLNEAYGYELLLNAGYEKENIVFIQSSRSAPDLEGTKTDEAALVEVKTMNVSDREVERLREWPPKARRAHQGIPETLVAKIGSAVEKAVQQVESYCGNSGKRKIVLVLLSLDSDVRRGSELDRQGDDIKRKHPEHEVVIEIISGLD